MMPKRRRERDRPKAGPEAAYDPNKRVLLSYDSDGEESGDELNQAPDTVSALPGAAAKVQSESAGRDEATDNDGISSCLKAPGHEEDAVAGAEDENEDIENDLEEGIGEEREDDGPTHTDNHSLFTRGARKNNFTGQWPALGSLAYSYEDVDEEEEYDSEQEEALAYLRAVRSERQSLPAVFTAPTTFTDDELYDNGIGDMRGYYEDGAYVGRAIIGPSMPESAKVLVEPQEAFVAALTTRFLEQRTQMYLSPGPNALAQLDFEHPITYPATSDSAHIEWHRLLRTTVPLPAQVRSMEEDVVWRLLARVQKHYLRPRRLIAKCTSAWIWALLSKLGDVGSMDNDHVSTVREFGKKAVAVQLSFQDTTTAELLAQAIGGDRDGETEDLGEDSEKDDKTEDDSKRSATGTIADSVAEVAQDDAPAVNKPEEGAEAKLNTFATLDMIIVVIGQVFGQRDLLEFRQAWDVKPESMESHS